jgi:Fe-S-cluster containining protein
VTGADILRLEAALGLPFWEFVWRWADEHGMISRNHAPQFHFRDEPHTPFVICLMHEASETFPGTTKCRFLAESAPDAEHPLGQARCGVYEHRPAACRAFPVRLNATSDLAVVYDVPQSGRDAEHPAYRLCPRQWQPSDLDPVQTVQDLVVARYEMAFFAQLAKRWNQAPGPWSVFPDFLRTVYGSRVVRESMLEESAREMAAADSTTQLARTAWQRVEKKWDRHLAR